MIGRYLLPWIACLSLASAQTEWQSLSKQTDELYAKGDLAGALRTAKLGLAAASSPEQEGRMLDRMGFLNYSLGNAKEAEALLRKALETRGRAGRQTAGYAETLLNLAMLLRDSARFDEALPLANEGSEIRSIVFGKFNPLYAEALNVVATIYAVSGQYEKAEGPFDAALKVHESQPEPSEEYGTLCTNYAGTSQRSGKYQKAKSLFEKALSLLAKKPGTEHPAYSATLVASAFLDQELGDYAAADRKYAEAVKLLIRQLGEGSPHVGTALNNQAMLHLKLGDRKTAEDLFRRSLLIRRKGSDPIGLVSTIRNLGEVVYPRDPEEGTRLFKEAVDVIEGLSTRPSHEHATSLFMLGRAMRERMELTVSRQALERALDIVEKSLGTQHPLYSAGLHQLALTKQAQGATAEAIRDLNRAVEITSDAKGESHPDQARNLVALANLHRSESDYANSFQFFRRALEVQNQSLTRAMAIGSETAKTSAAATLDDLVPALISFQQAAGDTLPEARVLAFEAVAAQKTRALDLLKDWRARLRSSAGETNRARIDEWQQIAECQSTLAVALAFRDWRRSPAGRCPLGNAELTARHERLAHDLRSSWTVARGRQAVQAIRDLQRRAEEIEATLSRDVPAFRSAASGVRFGDIQSELRADELLLEIVSFRSVDSGQPGEHYGAFIVGKAGIEWIDIGPAKPINEAVADILEAAADWSTSISRRQPRSSAAAADTAQRALEELSEKWFAAVWRRLSARGEIRRLRIAPDGVLSLLPFEALMYRGTTVVDRFVVSYVGSGRDLILAAPFDRSSLGPAVIAVSPGTKTMRPLKNVFRTEQLDLLQGAQRETRRLRSLLPSAQVLAEGEATEDAIKHVERPALLHIIGHGVIRGKSKCEEEGRTASSCELDTIDPPARIMNLSAIVLEEAYSRGKNSSQDGLLTAQELRSVNLEGTHMLVLSQCRMADGVAVSGDGVYGMRRAAVLSGAQSLVAPLWNVADSIQQGLMEKFYVELARGRDRAEALRLAKLEVRSRPGQRHFLHWAATVLSGEDGTLPQELFKVPHKPSTFVSGQSGTIQ